MSDSRTRPGRVATAVRPAMPRALPMWPVMVMFGLVPLWWVLGGFFLAWPAFGLLLFTVLLTRGRIALPPGTALWSLLLALVLLSALRIDRATAYLSFGLRVGFLVTGLLVGVYVYNLARDGTPTHRLLRPLGLFWLTLVGLGWLGVLLPTLAITTVTEMLLPAQLADTKFLQSLVHVRSNEFNLLSANPIYRTSAPFPHTNNWGTAYSLLMPCVVAYLTSVKGGAFRTVLLVSLPLSVVPAFMTLNRGMFFSLGIGLVYLAGRALLRRDVRPLLSITVLVGLFWVFTLIVPVQDRIAERVSTTDTNVDRLDLYVQTWQAVLESPLLGYGSPKYVDTTLAEEPLGTQGMLWNVLYSHGIPALIIFVLWSLVMVRRMAAGVGPAAQWLSAVPVIALVIIPVYGYIDPNLSVIFFALGVGLAAPDRQVARRPPAPAPHPSPAVGPGAGPAPAVETQPVPA